MSAELSLAIRYTGYGLTCSNCGRLRETTSYTLSKSRTEELLQEFRLCDKCQDEGFVINFRTNLYGVTDHRAARRVRISQNLEKALAADVHGKVQPGSGNQDEKADVRVIGEWRMEHKYTDSAKSYTLQVRDLAAIVSHANMAGEWPALVLTFRKLNRKFVTLPYELFLELIGRLRGE